MPLAVIGHPKPPTVVLVNPATTRTGGVISTPAPLAELRASSPTLRWYAAFMWCSPSASETPP
jgi:hypothetical protein